MGEAMRVLIVAPGELWTCYHVAEHYLVDEIYEADEVEPGNRFFVDTDYVVYAGGEDEDNEYVDLDFGKLVWRRIT
jgi:hypothetical protein